MRERPLLMSDPMVRAILDGRKTQTRRVMRTNHVGYVAFHRWDGELGARAVMRCANETHPGSSVFCEDNRIGRPGDQLWVRECFALHRIHDGNAPSKVKPSLLLNVAYRATGDDHDGAWRPSIHMPRWASRLTLRVTDIRVERVQDISEDDARAEGVYPLAGGFCAGDADAEWCTTARDAFRELWSNTYGAESWAANPWVWVVSFEREGVSRG